MKIGRNWCAVTTPTVVVIGNFDGVHAGHTALLQTASRRAATAEASLLALTFEPHPLAILRPADAPKRVIDLRTKVTELAAAGVAQTNVMHFTKSFAAIEAQIFVQRLLREFGMQCLVVGRDFRFGKGRVGNIDLLQKLAKDLGFELEICSDHATTSGVRVSSKLLRTTIAAADFATAAALLGRPYRFGGRVTHGSKLGRELGCPTANLALRSEPPLHGVYAAWALLDNERYGAALAVGHRPAVKGSKLVAEAHLLNFSSDLYGRYLSLEPVSKLRDERDFPDLASLRAAIAQDIRNCDKVLDSAG